MADESKNPKNKFNDYAWVTREKFLEFMKLRNISMNCERCGRDDKWWIDTGAHGGHVPRLPSMPTTENGVADTSNTYQMPVVRATCVNCGNIRLHALLAFDIHKMFGDNYKIIMSDTFDGLTVTKADTDDNS